MKFLKGIKMSKNKNANESAFVAINMDGRYDGLTKREYMATQLMAGLLANSSNIDNLMTDDATLAVEAADALLAELAKSTTE
jgi:hypothetical protein